MSSVTKKNSLNQGKAMIEIDQTQDANGVKHWFSEIDAAIKRDTDYRKEGKRINGIYEAESENKTPFNILYSNTDTLLPALYSAIPRPIIKRRFKDDAPLAMAASEAGKRMLSYLLDTNIDGYETFGEALNSATLDALLPGRGITRVKYDAEIGEYEELSGSDEGDDNEPNADDGENEDRGEAGHGMDSGGEGEAEEGVGSVTLRKESELVCIDSVAWNGVLFGYAKKWSKVPWIAFEETIDKDEAIRLFGKDVASKIKFTKGEESPDEKDSSEQDDHTGERKTALIFQIWDKDGGRKVRYVSRHYKDGFLKVEDDPLELTGFYPIPRPLQVVAKSNNMTVTAPYLLYENQAKEINDLTIRINRIVRAIKVRGVYDSELKADIGNLLDGDDNEMISAEKSSALANDKGFENAIWFMPIEKLIAVLRELYAAREQCKQVIYEVTGISDIIRGSTVASETATAQSIKSQWGTMRLKRSQAEVQRYCRDLLRIMLEVSATKFSVETWAKVTGLPFLTDQQVMQAQMIAQAAQAQAAQYAANPEQIPPQIQQALQQAQAEMQKPQWSQVIDLLKSDMDRSYQIDIETNSTVIPEATEDKQNTNEALTALGTFIKESLPVVQSGVMPFGAFKAVLLKISRQFEFGEDIEGELQSMKEPPQPQQPQDNSLQVKQLELQSKQAESQSAAQVEQMKLEMQRLIAEGEAKTQLHIEQMRIDSAERIAKYQADLQAQTQLQIAAMSAQQQPEVNDEQFS